MRKTIFVDSTCPFLCGCSTYMKCILMLRSSKSVLMFLSVNWVPLSVTTVWELQTLIVYSSWKIWWFVFIYFKKWFGFNQFRKVMHNNNKKLDLAHNFMECVLLIFGYQSINWFWTFNLWTFYFYFWEGKKREKPLEIVDPGVGFEKRRFDAP